MLRISCFLLTLLLAVSGTGCQFLPGRTVLPVVAKPMVQVSGSVTYREPVAAPPGARVIVKWLDVSRADAPAIVMARQEIPLDLNGVPVDYVLAVERSLLMPQLTYVIRAEIRLEDDSLLWTSDTARQFDIEPDSQTLSPITLIQVSDRTESAAGLSGAWRVEMIDGKGVIDYSATSFDFSMPGQISGRAGCNSYRATAQLNRGSITLGPIAVTKKLCPPALQDQELRFLALLEQISHYESDATGTLVLSTTDGRQIRATR